MYGYGRSRFANTLNSMLEKSSLSAEDVVDALNDCGFPLPQKTFSYWLQGYFLPRNDAAFKLVAALEEIFGVQQSDLSEALIQDLVSGASFVPGEFTEGSSVPALPTAQDNVESHFAILDAKIDWEADLVRKVIHDDVKVSADRTHLWYTATVLARVPSVPNPSFTASVAYDEGDKPGGSEHFYNVKGARMGKQEMYEENGVTVFGIQFYLPDNVVPGEIHRISYAWDLIMASPKNFTIARSFPWLLDFYSCSLTFEGTVPQGIEYVMRDSDGNERVAESKDVSFIQDGNLLRMSAKNFGQHTGFFRWVDEGAV